MTHNRYRLVIVKDRYVYMQEWKYVEKKANGNSLYRWIHIGAWGSPEANSVLNMVSDAKKQELIRRFKEMTAYLEELGIELKGINKEGMDKQEYSRLKREIKNSIKDHLSNKSNKAAS